MVAWIFYSEDNKETREETAMGKRTRPQPSLAFNGVGAGMDLSWEKNTVVVEGPRPSGLRAQMRAVTSLNDPILAVQPLAGKRDTIGT